MLLASRTRRAIGGLWRTVVEALASVSHRARRRAPDAGERAGLPRPHGADCTAADAGPRGVGSGRPHLLVTGRVEHHERAALGERGVAELPRDAGAEVDEVLVEEVDGHDGHWCRSPPMGRRPPADPSATGDHRAIGGGNAPPSDGYGAGRAPRNPRPARPRGRCPHPPVVLTRQVTPNRLRPRNESVPR